MARSRISLPALVAALAASSLTTPGAVRKALKRLPPPQSDPGELGDAVAMCYEAAASPPIPLPVPDSLLGLVESDSPALLQAPGDGEAPQAQDFRTRLLQCLEPLERGGVDTGNVRVLARLKDGKPEAGLRVRRTPKVHPKVTWGTGPEDSRLLAAWFSASPPQDSAVGNRNPRLKELLGP